MGKIDLSKYVAIGGTAATSVLYNAEGLVQKRRSDLGTTLRSGGLTGRYEFMPVTLGGVKLPNAVVSLTGRKTIVETSLVGRRGTMKELVGLGDYEIRLSGAAFGSDWPEGAISSLKSVFAENKAVELKCALTDIFLDESTDVVVKRLELPESCGYENVQRYVIDVVTDSGFELLME